MRTYRRFFTVDDLAAVRVEDPEVFAATHAEIGSWFTDGLADGLRVDHPDGLADPIGYLHRLRELVGPEPWIVIEKILETGEPLEPTLPVAGTTGYDALRELGHAMIDPAGEAPLGELHERWTGDRGAGPWNSVANLRIRDELAAHDLAPEFARLARAARADTGSPLPLDDLTAGALHWINEIPYYRDDYPVLAVPAASIRQLSAHTAGNTHAAPGLQPAVQTLAAARDAHGETAARFAQLTGALTAKTLEDTAFYRTARLISLQEVGGAPSEFGPSDPHPAFSRRAVDWPAAMTTLSTHDTKRGEDVRARIGVLSQCPELWADRIDRWTALVPSPPDPATGLLLWQTLFGVWPDDGAVTDELRTRLHAYARKAMREGRIGTSWTAPDAGFEAAGHTFVDAVLDGPVAAEMTELLSLLGPHGRSDSLTQKLLQIAGPGVPDIYQGTERWEDSLVDPDNRRPVDWAALVPGDHPKQRLVRETLHVRRERPGSFVGGGYGPIRAEGQAAGHLLGFARGRDVIALGTRLSLRLERSGGWRGTRVQLPDGDWRDRFTGAIHAGQTSIQGVFVEHPVALLVRD